MANESAEVLIKELFLISVSVGQDGKERETVVRNVRTLPNGGVEVEKDLTETCANEEEFRKASALATKLRDLPKQFGTVMRGIGTLTGPAGKEKFEVAYARLLREVARHNAYAPPGFAEQPCPIEHTMDVIPIGVAFGPKQVARVLATVSDGLNEAHAMLKAGNVSGPGSLENWLKRGKTLANLVPALNANAVETALVALRDARNAVAERIREQHLAEGVARGEKVALDMALNDPTVAAASEAVDIALGWLVPSEQQSNETAVAV